MSAGPADSFLWIDEGLTEAENDAHVRNDPELQDHVRIIHRTFEVFKLVLERHPAEKAEVIWLLRLGVRIFNSGAAAMKLARSGYYHQSLSIIRDIIETQFLADLFSREPDALTEWATSARKQREKRFSPREVRKRLNLLDGYEKDMRGEIYRDFSNYASHVSPEGFAVISPGGDTRIGPFPSSELTSATIQELAKHLPYSFTIISTCLSYEDETVLAHIKKYYDDLSAWKSKYFGASGKSSPKLPAEPAG